MHIEIEGRLQELGGVGRPETSAFVTAVGAKDERYGCRPQFHKFTATKIRKSNTSKAVKAIRQCANWVEIRNRQ